MRKCILLRKAKFKKMGENPIFFYLSVSRYIRKIAGIISVTEEFATKTKGPLPKSQNVLSNIDRLS